MFINHYKKSAIRAVNLILSVAFVIGSSPIALALSVSSTSPSKGPISGGNQIIVRGEGFLRQENEKFSDISAGVNHLVLLSKSGQVWTMGQNDKGQLGNGSLQKFSIDPQNITPRFSLQGNDKIDKISSGDNYSFAISENHRVFAWGDNKWGQLGYGTRGGFKSNPVEIKFSLIADDYITNIYAGVETVFAVSDKGETFVWGDSRDFLDGQNNESYSFNASPVKATSWLGENIEKISLGNRSIIDINASSRVSTWGDNEWGQLGRTKGSSPNDIDRKRPQWNITDNFLLSNEDRIVDVEAGNGVMAALTKLHRVFIWGDNTKGMLGIGDDEPNPNDSANGSRITSTPIDISQKFPLADDDAIAEISIGNSQVIALSQYGRVFTWGDGQYGQLGNGDTNGRNVVSEITDQFNLEGNNTIQKVVAGGVSDYGLAGYSYALDSDGQVYRFGGQKKGFSGSHSFSNHLIPSIISEPLTSNLNNVSEIKIGNTVVENYQVLSDTQIRLTVPKSDKAETVGVYLTDESGSEYSIDTGYTYIDPDVEILLDNSAKPKKQDIFTRKDGGVKIDKVNKKTIADSLDKNDTESNSSDISNKSKDSVNKNKDLLKYLNQYNRKDYPDNINNRQKGFLDKLRNKANYRQQYLNSHTKIAPPNSGARVF